MNRQPDDRSEHSQEHAIREAFNDLNRRAMMIPTNNGPHNNRSFNFGRQPGRGPLIPALALAAVALVGIGAVSLWPQGDDTTVNVAADAQDNTDQDDGLASESNEPTDDGDTGTNDDSSADTSDNASADADDSDGDDSDGDADGNSESGTDGSSDSDTDSSSESDAESDTESDATDLTNVDVLAFERLRVNTDRVSADGNDPFLNVRADVGSNSAVVAKLPPGYRGIRATGKSTETDDGAAWVQVELMHPVPVDGVDVEAYDRPTGWLNAALALPLVDGLSVSQDEVPACTGEHVLTSSTGSGEFHVAGLESAVLNGNCLRTVVTMAEGSAGFEWPQAQPVVGLPDVGVIDTDLGTIIDLGSTNTAWPTATDTDSGAFIVRDGDQYLAANECASSCVDLVVPVPASSVTATMLPDLGIIVVDLSLDGQAAFDSSRQVHLTAEPRIGSDSILVEGIARPFEANLGVEIVDAGGSPVTARFSGSTMGVVEGAEYGVSTNDWTEAWGRFSFTAEGLAPGDYVLRLDGEGGADQPRVDEVSFTIN